MNKTKKPLHKKWWVWLIAFFAILVIYGAVTGINQAKYDIENPKEEEVAEAEEEEEAEEVPDEQKESDPEAIKKYVDSFDTLQEELETEYAERIEDNNINNWGPFFSDYEDKINAAQEDIEEADLKREDRQNLNLVHGNLNMLAVQYGKAISGEADEELIEHIKEDIKLDRSQYE